MELQRSLDRERQGRSEAETLLSCLGEVQKAKDSRQSFQVAMDFIFEYIQCEEGILLLIEEEELEVLASTSRGIANLPWKTTEIPPRALAGKALRLFDLQRSSSFNLVRDEMDQVSCMCVPLQYKKSHICIIFFSKERSFFGPEHLRLLKRVGTLVGHAHGRLEIERLNLSSLEADTRAREAEVSIKIKSEFIANMSHELRTPLNGIIANLELAMLDELASSPKSCLETAQFSANNLYRLVSDILDLSHADVGPMVLAQEEYDLRECLNFAVDSLAGDAKAKGLCLKVEIDSALPQKVKGDKHRISQLLMNLIDNAIKFSDEGGIKVTCSGHQDEDGSRTMQLLVADTGRGIHQDDMVRVFEKFEQVDGTIGKQTDGGGLGLAVVKRILDAMDGSVHVESEVGAGSRFQVYFPILPVMDPSRPEASCQVEESPNTDMVTRVLLVEDNPINQLMTMRVLEKLGHYAELAKNGQEAVDLLQYTNFDIILIDIHMPVLDGLEATKEIRAMSHDAASTTIIALTASAMIGSREKCLEVGMDEYLSKPVRIKELKSMIEKFLVVDSLA